MQPLASNIFLCDNFLLKTAGIPKIVIPVHHSKLMNTTWTTTRARTRPWLRTRLLPRLEPRLSPARVELVCCGGGAGRLVAGVPADVEVCAALIEGEVDRTAEIARPGQPHRAGLEPERRLLIGKACSGSPLVVHKQCSMAEAAARSARVVRAVSEEKCCV